MVNALMFFAPDDAAPLPAALTPFRLRLATLGPLFEQLERSGREQGAAWRALGKTLRRLRRQRVWRARLYLWRRRLKAAGLPMPRRA